VIIGIRPTDFLLAETAPPSLPRLTATVEVVEDLGTELFALFPINAPRIDVDSFGGVPDVSDDERLLADDGRSLFTARIEPGHRIGPGDRVELAIQTSRLKFFDPTTGLAIAPPQPVAAAAAISALAPQPGSGSLDRADGQSANEVALEESEDQDRRDHRHQQSR
jgi:multiple sugar transport system ATP-binding protein